MRRCLRGDGTENFLCLGLASEISLTFCYYLKRYGRIGIITKEKELKKHILSGGSPLSFVRPNDLERIARQTLIKTLRHLFVVGFFAF